MIPLHAELFDAVIEVLRMSDMECYKDHDPDDSPATQECLHCQCRATATKLLEVRAAHPDADIGADGVLLCPRCASKDLEYWEEETCRRDIERYARNASDVTIFVRSGSSRSFDDNGENERLGCTACALPIEIPAGYHIDWV